MQEPMPPPLPPKPSAQGRSLLVPVLIAAVCGGSFVALGCGGLMCGGLLFLQSAPSQQDAALPVTLPAGHVVTPQEAVADFVPAQVGPADIAAEGGPEMWRLPNDSNFVERPLSSEAPRRGDDAEAAAVGVLGGILGKMFGGDEEYEPLSQEEEFESSTREFEERKYFREEYERARAERERED